jgi:C_GCAxxG_C_C family probable redox protein
VSTKEERQEIIERVSKKAGDNFELCINCAKSTLSALQEEFNLGGAEAVIKAASFMPGIGYRKETGGGVIGGLMALGLAFGREKLFDPEWRAPKAVEEMFEIKGKIQRFCNDFEKEIGSIRCGDIRPKLMGPEYINYDSMDPKWRERYLREGGTKKCRVPVEVAARIAAAIILERSQETGQ